MVYSFFNTLFAVTFNNNKIDSKNRIGKRIIDSKLPIIVFQIKSEEFKKPRMTKTDLRSHPKDSNNKPDNIFPNCMSLITQTLTNLATLCFSIPKYIFQLKVLETE